MMFCKSQFSLSIWNVNLFLALLCNAILLGKGFFFVHFSECVFLNKTKLPAFIKKKELESLLQNTDTRFSFIKSVLIFLL